MFLSLLYLCFYYKSSLLLIYGTFLAVKLFANLSNPLALYIIFQFRKEYQYVLLCWEYFYSEKYNSIFNHPITVISIPGYSGKCLRKLKSWGKKSEVIHRGYIHSDYCWVPVFNLITPSDPFTLRIWLLKQNYFAYTAVNGNCNSSQQPFVTKDYTYYQSFTKYRNAL